MNYHLPTEGKKNRLSFWGKLFGSSKKSGNKEKNSDQSFGRNSSLYHSFHCTNIQQNSHETEDEPENFTTLENSAFMEMHKDAGIIFLNKNPLGNCMTLPKEEDKHVHFVPTPQNKYYRVDVKAAPSRKSKKEENKENVEQPNSSKPSRPILRLGKIRETESKKGTIQNATEANKIKVNVAYVDGPQVKKTPIIPRTSTKIALLDRKNGSFPHLNVSGIAQYGSLPRFATFRGENYPQNEFHSSAHSDNTKTKLTFPTATNQQIVTSSDAEFQGRSVGRIDKSGRFSIPDLPRHVEQSRNTVQLRSGSNQNISHRLSIGDPLVYSRGMGIRNIPDCYGRNHDAIQSQLDYQRPCSNPSQPFSGKAMVDEGLRQRQRVPAFASSVSKSTIDISGKPNGNLQLPNKAINEVGLPLTTFKREEKFIASRSESPHYIPLAETYSSSCISIQQKKCDNNGCNSQTCMRTRNGNFIKPFNPVQSNEFTKRSLTSESNAPSSFRRDNSSKMTQTNEIRDDSTEYSHFFNQAKRQVIRSSMYSQKRKSFNKICKYKSKECEDGFSSMADDECSFNCSCSSCMLRFSRESRKNANKNSVQQKKDDQYFFICTDIKEENESEAVPDVLPTDVNSEKCIVEVMEAEIPTNTTWYNCNDSLCKTPKVDPLTPQNKNNTKSLVQDIQSDKIAECLYENITQIINSATKRNLRTQDVERMFSTPLSKPKIKKQASSGKIARSLFSSTENVQTTKRALTPLKSPVVFSDSVILLQEIFQKLSQECKELLQPDVSLTVPHNAEAVDASRNSNSSGSKYVNDLVKNLRSSNAISEGDFASIIGGIAQNIFLEAKLKRTTQCLTQSASLPDLTRNDEESQEINTKWRSSLEDLSKFQHQNVDITSVDNVTDSGFKTECDTKNETVESSNGTRNETNDTDGRDFPDGWSRTPTTENNTTSSVSENSSSAKDDSRSSESDMQLLENAIRLGMGLSPIKKIAKPTFYACSPAKASKFKSRDVLSCKGKLKLKIYHNSGLVTVHVMRGAKLLRINGRDLNPYIKVSMVPDTSKRVHWRTSVVKGQKSPVFNQKFSFEVLAEDSSKRLVFSVWHRDFTKERSELVGCMSFSVRHVLDDTHRIDGWYRLLREGFGTQKHFAAHKKNSCPPKRLK